MEELVNVVNAVGFPIGAFLMMFWFATKTVKDNTKAINNLKVAIEQLKLKK